MAGNLNLNVLKENWPCLLHTPFTYRHSQKVADEKMEEIIQLIFKRKIRILTFGHMKRYISIDKAIQDETKHWFMIQTIFARFKFEEIRFLFPSKKVRY